MTTLPLNQALSIFEDSLPDIKVALEVNMQHALDNIQKFEGPLKEDMYQLQVKQAVGPMAHTHKRIVARQQHLQTPNAKGVSQTQIDTARDYPIQQLYAELTAMPIRRGMGKCPLHPDQTASFSMQKYNRYKCFGCQEKGSTIDLYMKINNTNFVQAVRALQ